MWSYLAQSEHTHRKIDLFSSKWTNSLQNGPVQLKVLKTHHKVNLSSSKWINSPHCGTIQLCVNTFTTKWTNSIKCEQTHQIVDLFSSKVDLFRSVNTLQSGPIPLNVNKLTKAWTYSALWTHSPQRDLFSSLNTLTQWTYTPLNVNKPTKM